MKKIVSVVCFLMAVAGLCSAQEEMRTIHIGQLSTTHVLFSTDLTYVDISMPEFIAAKIVDASKNMMALKAKKEFDFITTISALEANGTMHTFKVCFDDFPEELVVDTRNDGKASSVTETETVQESSQQKGESESDSSRKSRKRSKKGIHAGQVNITTPGTSNFGRKDAPTIEEVTKEPQEIFHIGDKTFNIEVYCTNIYVYSDMTYIVLTIKNNSDIGFDAGDAQFTIENVVRNGKGLATDKPIWPKSSYGSLSCAPKSTSVVGYTIPKMTLLKDECLRIYIYEKSGKRNLILTLYDKDINYAISPK